MTEEQIATIISHWDSLTDTWQGDTGWTGNEELDSVFVYPPTQFLSRPGYRFRDLPEYTKEQAQRYIATLTRQYPLQLRVLLGLPMWLRFCETWNDTGDQRKAMRVI